MIGDLLNPVHLVLILAAALLVLGPKRMPEVGRALGSGLRSFRSAMSGVQEEADAMLNDVSVDLPEPARTRVAPTVSAEVAETIEPIPAEHAEAAAAHAEQVAVASQPEAKPEADQSE